MAKCNSKAPDPVTVNGDMYTPRCVLADGHEGRCRDYVADHYAGMFFTWARDDMQIPEGWICVNGITWLHESGWSVTRHETGLSTVWWALKPDGGVFENQSWDTAGEARVWVEEQL